LSASPNRGTIAAMSTSPWPVVGHDWAVTLLQRAIESGRTAHAYLITGLEHIGKSTLARTLAQALNCTNQPAPCGREACRACKLIAAGKYPDLHLVAPDGNTLKIDQVRALQHDLALAPMEGRFRVAILDGMDKATAEASNALLKTLEEPPPHVVLVLIAPEAEALLPTIVSRCQPIALRPLSVKVVRAALMERWGVESTRAESLAHLSGGRLGWAVMAAQDESVLARRAQLLDDLARLTGQGRVERFAYAEEMAADSVAARETLKLWQTWWRDALLLAAGSGAALTNSDRNDALRRHAAQFGVEGTRAAAANLGRALWQLDHNANARLALEVLMLDLPRVSDSPSATT
jgi:DNA polymerase-3 subunit delta'